MAGTDWTEDTLADERIYTMDMEENDKSRMQIIGKTWTHTAYSRDSVFARSDREIVRVRLPVLRYRV